LAEMHELVRKKLGLGKNDEIRLSWMYEQERMSLDDSAFSSFITLFHIDQVLDDDFAGFSVYARTVLSVVVRVTESTTSGRPAPTATPPQEPAPEPEPKPDQPPPKKRKKVQLPAEDGPQSSIQNITAKATGAMSIVQGPSQATTSAKEKTLSKKRSKKNLISVQSASADILVWSFFFYRDEVSLTTSRPFHPCLR
jgi:hypothetical protein